MKIHRIKLLAVFFIIVSCFEMSSQNIQNKTLSNFLNNIQEIDKDYCFTKEDFESVINNRSQLKSINKNIVRNFLEEDSVKANLFKYFELKKKKINSNCLILFVVEYPSGGVSFSVNAKLLDRNQDAIKSYQLGKYIIDGSHCFVDQFCLKNRLVERTKSSYKYDEYKNTFTLLSSDNDEFSLW